MGNECPMSVRSPFYLLRMEHRIEGEERDRTEWEGEGGGRAAVSVRPIERGESLIVLMWPKTNLDTVAGGGRGRGSERSCK